MVSSSQKNFKLCLSIRVPTKAPHICDTCSTISFIFSWSFPPSNKLSDNLLLKKSYRLSLAGIEAMFILEYLKASMIIPHIISLYLDASSSGIGLPSSSNRLTFSPQECTTVFVCLARSRIGFWSVPCIQFAPVSIRMLVFGSRTWFTLPPTRSRPSRMVTRKPCWSKTSAQRRPATPAPTIPTCGGEGGFNVRCCFRQQNSRCNIRYQSLGYVMYRPGFSTQGGNHEAVVLPYMPIRTLTVPIFWFRGLAPDWPYER